MKNPQIVYKVTTHVHTQIDSFHIQTESRNIKNMENFWKLAETNLKKL